MASLAARIGNTSTSSRTMTLDPSEALNILQNSREAKRKRHPTSDDSKHRKRAAISANRSSEPEEGELVSDEDDEVQQLAVPKATAPPTPSLPFSASLPPKPTLSPATRTPSTMPTTPHSSLPMNPKLREQQECRHIVDQLVHWGVTADYLLSCGVNKELVALCLHELGHVLPPNLLPLAGKAFLPPRPASRSAPPPAKARKPVQPPSPMPIEVDPPSDPIALPESTSVVPNPELAELEAQRRRELMQRKAAVAKARQFHNEIAGLFAAAQSDMMTLDQEEERLSSEEMVSSTPDLMPSPPPADEPSAHAAQAEISHHIADMRQLAEEVAELSPGQVSPFHTVPTPVPSRKPSTNSSLSLDISSSFGSGISPVISTGSIPSYTPRTNRPVASDFELDPSHALPQHPKRPSTSGIFVPDLARQTKVVIDLSEDEASDDEGSPGAAPRAAAEDAEEKRKRLLEMKEKEIALAKEQIARMKAAAKKKKASAGKGSRPDTPTLQASNLPSGVSTPLTAACDDSINEATAEVMKLEGEREDILAQEAVDTASAHQGEVHVSSEIKREESEPAEWNGIESNTSSISEDTSSDSGSGNDDAMKLVPPGTALDLPDATDPTQTGLQVVLAPPAVVALTRFGPYLSYLSSFPLLASSPQLLQSKQLILALNTFVASQQAEDTFLCSFEADGGVCADPACQRVHWSKFIPSNGDLLDFIDTVYADDRLPTDWSKEKVEVFRRGLKATTSTIDRTSSSGLSYDSAESLISRIQAFYLQLKPFSKATSN